MTVAERLRDFQQAVRKAVQRHLPRADWTLEQKRGILLDGRIELDDQTFISVYFNALTGKTSYALVRQGQRVAGYDNYKFWHYHPPGEVDRHQPYDEPTPEEAIVSLIEGLSR